MVVLADEPSDLTFGLAAEAGPQPVETVLELPVPCRRLAEEAPRPLDPLFGEGPDEGGRVDRVEEVVRRDVVGELLTAR